MTPQHMCAACGFWGKLGVEEARRPKVWESAAPILIELSN